MAVFQKIASFRQRCGLEKPDAWPLWLPASHRVLVFSNLASEVIGTSKQQTAPDRYIVDGVISAISEVLEKPQLLVDSSNVSPLSLFVEEYVPLSLNNARMFASAIMRLQVKDRLSTLVSLLDVAQAGLETIKSHKQMLEKERGVSCFLGRLVSLCSYLAISLSCQSTLPGKILRLGMSQGCYLTKAPPAVDYYRSQNCFFELTEDWETSITEAEVSFSSMKKDLCVKLQDFLEHSFSLSFTSAAVDQCFFVFSSWVALGKSDLWTENENRIAPYSGLPDDLSSLMLQLRNEMCYVHRLILKANGISSLTSLLCVAEQKDNATKMLSRKATATMVRKELRLMITKASALCIDLLRRFVQDDEAEGQNIQLKTLVVFEMLSAYLSFAIASHTKPSADFFTYTRSCLSENVTEKRPRGYSSGSEQYPTDDESNDTVDIAIEAFDRVEAACSAFGGVPAHPDWLDLDCQYWEAISSADATEAAQDALNSLSQLAAISFDQAEASRCRSVVGKPEHVVRLVFNLTKVRDYEIYTSTAVEGADRRNVDKDISQVCDMDSSILEMWNSGMLDEGRESIARCWARTASQRILGSQQGILKSGQFSQLSRHVLRAAGEWEVLLSVSLTTCGSNVASRFTGISTDIIDCDHLDRSIKWYSVYRAACGGMMPASALLRFSLSKVGRPVHPLRSMDSCVDAFCLADLDLSLKCALPESLSQVTKDSVARALTVVTRDFYDSEMICDAVVTNLAVDEKPLHILRGCHACRYALTTLTALSGLAVQADKLDAFQFLFERITSVLDMYRGKASGTSATSSDVSFLMAALQNSGLTFKTIASDAISVCGALRDASKMGVATLDAGSEPVSSELLIGLVSLIWRDCTHVNLKTRLSCLNILCSLVNFEKLQRGEGYPLLSEYLAKALNSKESRLHALVQQDICSGLSPTASKEENRAANGIRRLLCVLCALLLSVNERQESHLAAEAQLFKILDDEFDLWRSLPLDSRQSVLNLWFIYACSCGQLKSVIDRLVNDLRVRCDIMSGSMLEAQNLACFGSFAEEMKKMLSAGVDSKSSATKKLKRDETDARVSRLCSYAVESGFIEQHWYNCYTCGLTGDKGCCTLCALICHEGHEVSYSRYSTFFCDCGAPDESRNQLKSSCRCQTPLRPEDAAEAYARGTGTTVLRTGISKNESFSTTGLSVHMCMLLLLKFLKKQPSASLDSICRAGLESEWSYLFYTLIKEGLSLHQSSRTGALVDDLSINTSYDDLRRRLRRRDTAAAIINGGSNRSFSLYAVFRPGSFQGKIPNESSVENSRRALLAHGVSCRSAIVADRRGRIAIAESNCVIFCTGLPLLNPAASVGRDSLLARSSICVLRKKSFDFNVMGMNFCGENDAHIAIWGLRNAMVCVLNDSRTDIVKRIELDLGLGSENSNFVIRCEWLPGSTTCLVVTCVTSILIFDVSKSSAAAIMIASETSFRGLVAIEVLGREGDPFCSSWKVFLLMDDGHLHGFDLVRDEDGDIEVENLNLESKCSIKLPIGSIPVDLDVPFSLTLGEGINLSYLEQSHLILYQAVSESVLALQLDAKGKITSSFTLLPKEITPQVLGGEASGSSVPVTGPFTHWVELGAVMDGTSVFFRVICIGRRSTKEPALLCIEFNEDETRVRELSLVSGAFSGISFSVEGVAAMSCPTGYGFAPSGQANLGTGFHERVAAFIYLSNGSIRIYAEERGPDASAASPGADPASTEPSEVIVDENRPVAPLLVFEKLHNITDEDLVVFEGDGLGR